MKKQVWITVSGITLLILGLILHFTKGNMFSSGDYSLNYFAAGDFACGVFAAGKFSVGIFSIGIFSLGIFSLGIFNVAIYAIGLFVFAYRKKLPKQLQVSLNAISKHVKTVIVICIFSFASMSGSAKESNGISLVGGFGGPILNTNIINNTSLSIGGGGAAVFSNGLFLGGFGLGTSDFLANESQLPNYTMKVEYGGLWTGFIQPINKKLSYSVSLKTGFGEAQLLNTTEKQLYYDNLMVFSPEFAISWRTAYISTIQLGVYYNLFTGIDFHNHVSYDFSGPGFSIMFKFGGGYF